MRILVTLMPLVMLLVGCVGRGEAAPHTIDLEITNPPGPTKRVEVPLGAEVTLRITTAIDDHAHLHGYELEQESVAGEPVEIIFTASMAGSYELESHVTDAVWLNLVVQ